MFTYLSDDQDACICSLVFSPKLNKVGILMFSSYCSLLMGVCAVLGLNTRSHVWKVSAVSLGNIGSPIMLTFKMKINKLKKKQRSVSCWEHLRNCLRFTHFSSRGDVLTSKILFTTSKNPFVDSFS